MKYLQILNVVLAALGAAMGVCLFVVALFYWIYLDRDPDLPRQLPLVNAAATGFAALFAAGLLAFLAHRRAWAGRWLAQLLPLAPIAGLALFFARLRG